jgi:hypothetical protein
METNSNSQIQPDATLPAAEPTAAELKAQLEEIKNQSEGRLRDLQQERAKRQELEARVASATSSVVKPDVTDDELGRVLKPYIEPVAKEAATAKQELEQMRIEKTQNYLQSKTGKSWDAIEADREFQDKMTQVIRKYGVTGNVYDMTVRAYELLQLEDLKTKEAERARAASAAQNATLPSGTGTVSSSSSKKYSAEEFNRMAPSEFGNLSTKGNFRKLPDGSFEYNPR